RRRHTRWPRDWSSDVCSSDLNLLGGTGTTASGTLTLANNLTLNSGSIIELALGASGAHSTLARTGGTWIFDATQAFTFIDLGARSEERRVGKECRSRVVRLV